MSSSRRRGSASLSESRSATAHRERAFPASQERRARASRAAYVFSAGEQSVVRRRRRSGGGRPRATMRGDIERQPVRVLEGVGSDQARRSPAAPAPCCSSASSGAARPASRAGRARANQGADLRPRRGCSSFPSRRPESGAGAPAPRRAPTSRPATRSDACVTGSEKSPPGGEIAPMMVTAPSRSGLTERANAAGPLEELAEAARRDRSGSPPRRASPAAARPSPAAPRPSATWSRSSAPRGSPVAKVLGDRDAEVDRRFARGDRHVRRVHDAAPCGPSPAGRCADRPVGETPSARRSSRCRARRSRRTTMTSASANLASDCSMTVLPVPKPPGTTTLPPSATGNRKVEHPLSRDERASPSGRRSRHGARRAHRPSLRQRERRAVVERCRPPRQTRIARRRRRPQSSGHSRRHENPVRRSRGVPQHCRARRRRSPRCPTATDGLKVHWRRRRA